MDGIWNVTLMKWKDNVIVDSDNNPSESGYYLCTCVRMFQMEELTRYLQVMYYDAERNYWCDYKTHGGVSHCVFAWTDAIKPCEFADYDYIAGGLFVEKKKDSDS